MVRPSLLPEATDDVLGEPSLVGVQAVDCVLRGDAGFAVANKLAEKAKLAKKGEVKVQATKAPKSATKAAKAAVTADAVASTNS